MTSAGILLAICAFLSATASAPAAGRDPAAARAPAARAAAARATAGPPHAERLFGVPLKAPQFDAARDLFRSDRARTGHGHAGRFAAGSAAGAPETVRVPLQDLHEEWDDIMGLWFGVFRVNYLNDSLGREIERTGQLWFGAGWENDYNLLLTYDADGRLTRTIGRNWNGGLWQSASKDSLVYNSYGLLVEELVEMYNGSVWLPSLRFVISYDGSLRLHEMVVQEWIASSWVDGGRYAATYDSEGRLSELLEQFWNGSAWVNQNRQTYSYDTMGNRTGEVVQVWTLGAWRNDLRYTWTRDGSGFVTETLNEGWNGAKWVNDTRDLYNNDPEGRPGDILTQYWDGFGWMDDFIEYISYDEGYPVEELFQQWTGAAWENRLKNSYGWQTIVRPSEITRHYAVDDGWNMVSVPLDAPDDSKEAIFPTAVSSAFSFDAGYQSSPVLENGRGYWLKFTGPQNVAVTGTMIRKDTVDVAAGWNMVGSIGAAVAASSVGSIPGGLVSSAFFAFDAGYASAAVIEPGRGYWVKVSNPGKLVFDADAAMPPAARLAMILSDDAPPPPPPDPPRDAAAAPRAFALEQNYPNPFNPSTTIGFELPARTHVRVVVYDAIGRVVGVLLDREMDAGRRSVPFDGAGLPSGAYTYRVVAGSSWEVGRMLLMK